MADATGHGLRPARRCVANAVLLTGSVAFSLVAMELLLALAGREPALRFALDVPPEVPWFERDPDMGSRYAGALYDEAWALNAQGYPDTDDFGAPPDHDGPRILLLGDSFTFGVRASAYGNAYSQVMEAVLDENGPVLVWNAAIPGTAQKQDLKMVQEFGPRLRPDVVVLGFYLNDFYENQFPMNMHYVFADGSWVIRYALAPGGEYVTLSPEAAYRRAHEAAGLRDVYLATRLGTLAESAWRRLSGRPAARTLPDGELHDHVLANTVDLVRQLRGEATALDAMLVALLIPQEGDLNVPSRHYSAARAMFADLGIPCCELRDALAKDDYLPMPDGHWTDSGHRKAGEKLAGFLEPLLRPESSS